MIAVYPGSFDPVTYGHLDIIERCCKKFDKVVVVVMNNCAKKYMFSLDERVELLKRETAHIENIEIDSYGGLLINYMHKKDAKILVKGLRALSDFEYEFQMALMNNCLDADIETFFLMTSNKYSFVSSSMVKEIAKYGGDISKIVTKNVEAAVLDRFKQSNQLVD